MAMKRCQHPNCGGRLGLGTVSKIVWVPRYWWYMTMHFCSKKCRDSFMTSRDNERERKTHGVYSTGPPTRR